MKKMQASVFKSRCLKVMDRVQATGEPVIVTKRGKPVVKVIPAEQEKVSVVWIHEGTDGDCRRYRISCRPAQRLECA